MYLSHTSRSTFWENIGEQETHIRGILEWVTGGLEGVQGVWKAGDAV